MPRWDLTEFHPVHRGEHRFHALLLSQGTTLYFSSDRPGSGNNPGANGNFAIYQVTYPPTVSGSPGSQNDGAVQITFPAAGGGTSNDYAPTVSADGSELTFIRCNSGTTSCALYVQNPIVGGTATLVSTAVALLQPNSVSGEASRPEIDPADPSQVLYEGTDNHIHLVSLASPPAFTERDLSNESGVATGQIDEYPDWNPAGTRIIFDRSHSVYVLDPTAGPATACGSGVRPIREPRSNRSSPRPTQPRPRPRPATLPGTCTCGPSSVVEATSFWTWATASPAQSHSANLTNNRTNNSQTAWQPIPLGAATPEVPMAALLPGRGPPFSLARSSSTGSGGEGSRQRASSKRADRIGDPRCLSRFTVGDLSLADEVRPRHMPTFFPAINEPGRGIRITRRRRSSLIDTAYAPAPRG